MNKCFVSFLVLYITGMYCASAQFTYDLTFQTGKVVKNYPRFPESDIAFVTRFSFNKKLAGGALWHQNYKYPEVTVQALYGSLGNKNELGNIAGLTGGLRFSKDVDYHWTLNLEGAFGAAHFNKPFNETNNIDNVAVGAKFTPLAMADAGVLYHFHPHWSAIAKISFLHCSDAHIHLPNLGINLPMISIGIRYRPIAASLVMNDDEKIIIDKKPKFNIRIALGLHEEGNADGPVNGPAFPVYLASFYIYRHYSPVARWQLGIEGYYNSGVYSYITSQQYYRDHEREKSYCAVMMFGNEYIFGHFSLVTQAGIYLYNPFFRDRFKDEGGDVREYVKQYVAGRFGFQYYLLNTFVKKHHNLFAGWYVKTNLAQADFMEMSLGYNF